MFDIVSYSQLTAVQGSLAMHLQVHLPADPQRPFNCSSQLRW